MRLFQFFHIHFLLVLILCCSFALAHHPCEIQFIRLTGARNWYLWNCRCTLPPLASRTFGRAIIPAPSPSLESLPRFNRAVKCYNHARKRLNLRQVCLHNPQRYDRLAAHALQQCDREANIHVMQDKQQPFRYNKAFCRADFIQVFKSNFTQAISICLCEQRQFHISPFPRVVVGRAAFETDLSPLGAEKEIALLNHCTEEMKERLMEGCATAPDDFNIFAAQLLEVCCKRVRDKTSLEKFECKAIVPDDISGLKVPV